MAKQSKKNNNAKKKRPIAPCRLCREEALLCRSHVIPEFLFKPAYDEKGRAVLASYTERYPHGWVQKGWREPLLCDRCEALLSRHERAFRRQWYTEGRLPQRVSDDVLRLSGLEYESFKLFHLSVLWRAHEASRPEFKQINLGPHAERLRLMLLADDPGDAWTIPFFGMVILERDQRVLDGMIMSPCEVRVQSWRVAEFTFGGCAWHYFTSSHSPRDLFSGRVPWAMTDGSLMLPMVNIQNFQPMNDFLGQWRPYYLASGARPLV